MAILANTNCNDRGQIRAAFLPFARPDYVEGMVCGDDLDSLLSAMYLHQKYDWPLAGVYSQYRRLWYAGDAAAFRQKLLSGKLFAVDLDIYHTAVPSLGHHIISLKNGDELPGHTHSLNPNAIRGFSTEHHFRRKYPLATIHFLLWLFSEKNLSPDAEMLIWLSDSAFVNAQHYRQNVEEWLSNFLSPSFFTTALPSLQTLEFEQNLKEKILRRMAENSLCRPGRAAYKSRYLGLNGFQCQFDDPDVRNADIQSLLAVLSAISGWRRLPFPLRFDGYFSGERHEIPVSTLNASDISFGEWLEQRGVFSYAFTFKDRLNYTVLR